MIVVVHKPFPFIYLAMPKTGSTTLRTVVYYTWNNGTGADRYETFSREDMARDHEGYAERWPNHLWFSTIRNPLSRAVSAWSEYRDRVPKPTATGLFLRYFALIKKADSFERSLFDEELNAIGFWDKHLPMMKFFSMTPGVSIHIRLEHLAADIKQKLLPMTKGPVPVLPRKRVGGYRSRGLSWQQQYTPGCYEKVCEQFSGDLSYCRALGLYTEEELSDPCKGSHGSSA